MMALLTVVFGLTIASTRAGLVDTRQNMCPDPESCTSLSCLMSVPVTTPELLTVWPVNSTQLTATWNITQCGLPPITAYMCTVQYFSQWDNTARTRTVTVLMPHHGSVSLGDLTPFTLYRLRVSCRKILGNTWSDYTQYAQARTNATVPGSAVNVQTPVTTSIVYKTGQRNMTLEWEPLPPIEHNGILLGYLIKVTDLREPSSIVVITADVNDSACTLDNLKLSGYRVNITAYNTEGMSPPKTVELSDIAMVPDQPIDLKAEMSPDGNITLAWQPPVAIGGIEQYSVFWCELETDTACRGKENVLSVPGTNTTTTLIDSWLPYRRYRLHVRASTSAGQGRPSDNIYKYMVEGVPSAPPHHVTVRAESATSAMMSWLPPPLVNRRGLLTAYQVYYSMGSVSDTEVTTVIIANDSQSAHSLLTNLKPFTLYSVRVSARTDAGEGNMSDPVSIRTKQSAPSDPPEHVAITNITTNSFVISWSPPPHPNGIILSHNVRHASQVTSLGKQTEGLVGGLKDGTNYSVSVQACTGAQESPCGPYSPVVYVQTLKNTNRKPDTIQPNQGASAVEIALGITGGLLAVLMISACVVVSAPKLRQTYRRISYVPEPKNFITDELSMTNGKSTTSLDQLYVISDRPKMAPEIVDNVTDYRTKEQESHDPASQSEIEESSVEVKEECGIDSDEVDYLKVAKVKDRFQDLNVIYVPKTGSTKREDCIS